MKERFEGRDGKRNLVAALLEQRLVQHQQNVADALADKGQIVQFSAGDPIIVQAGSENDVFFILSGEATVYVNNREVNKRGQHDAVGEMAVVDPAAPRSASVMARTTVVALKVAGADFDAAANLSPTVWRGTARVLSERLRQRERFHRPANAKPVMFIGSSAEGLSVVGSLEEHFKLDTSVVLRPWTTGVFGPSGVPLSDLLAKVEEADYALFVFGPDDKVSARGKDHDAPRDNVIFEMGLFMGRLGRRRVMMLMEHGADLKIPSDLLGITPVTYKCKGGCDVHDALAAPVNELKRHIRTHGAF